MIGDFILNFKDLKNISKNILFGSQILLRLDYNSFIWKLFLILLK